MDFMNAPVPQYYGAPPQQFQTPQMNMMQNQMMYQQQPVQQPFVMKKQEEYIPPKFELSHGKGLRFHVVDDANPENKYTIHEAGYGETLPSDIEQTESKKKKSTKKAKESEDNNLPSASMFSNSPSEPLQGTVETSPTAYTYAETTMMLRDTLAQIDSVNRELVQEFNAIKNNRTLKNKHNVMIGLSENIGSFIGNRISAIREINSSISKSNDLDYKKYKDIQAASSQMNDDKYIADMYKAFLSNPQMQPTMLDNNMPPIDQSIVGSGIVRASITENNFANGNFTDAGYMNYMMNQTPEQNLMRYEGNPDIKQVVVYDASTGYKQFQMMNMKTGEVIQNVPTYDQMFMEDTTLDLDQGIARNLNLNETFPLIVINDNVTSNY